MLKFNSLLLFSADPEKLADFYQDVFKKDPMWKDGGYTGWQLGNGMFMVGPHDKVHGKNKNPERMIINFETEDIKEEFKRIKKLGAKVIAEPYAPGGEGSDMLLATFADIDGNYFQLATPMEESPSSKAN